MKFSWSIILFPFSIVYGIITYVRNLCFDLGIFKKFIIPIKSIVVGNLAVGGTGKTPHVYYISKLLSEKFDVSVLSRGYGRKSKGYLDVLENSNSNDVGDEPLLLKSRLKNQTHIAVCESRKFGVQQLIEKFSPKLVVLDDAFQHRKVKAGLNILLTEYHRPFFDDYILPMGRLRESIKGKKRADIIIVTKCPDSISKDEKSFFKEKINLENIPIFFSTIRYSSFVSFSKKNVSSIESILLVTAIADDTKIVEYLSKSFSVKTFKFRDHHSFTTDDITKIHLKFDLLPKGNSIILTTEKDFVKLKEVDEVINAQYPWFFLPIDIEIDRQEEFNQLLIDYVGTV